MAILIAKADGEQEPFNPEKLTSSLMRAGAEHPLALDISRDIEADLYNGITTQEIYRRAFFKLRDARRGGAGRPAPQRRGFRGARRPVLPLEAYTPNLSGAEGAQTQIDQMIKGACV